MATFMTGDTSGGVQKKSGVTVDAEVAAAWNAVRNDAEGGFLVLSYSPPLSKTNVAVLMSGNGGLEGLRHTLSALPDVNSKVLWGGFASSPSSFAHFTFVGEDVSGMVR